MKYLKAFILVILFVPATVFLKKQSEININSKDLISYLKKEKLLDKVKYVCTDNYCSRDLLVNKEIEINNFIKSYINKVKKESLEDGVNIELKGFRINKIVYSS